MANINDQTTANGFNKTQSALSSLSASGRLSSSANWVQSLYDAGKNLQDSSDMLVEQTSNAWNQMTNTIEGMQATPDQFQSRTGMQEKLGAVQNTLGQITQSTLQNRNTLQKNAQAYAQGIGTMLTDATAAGEIGDAIYSSIAGNPETKNAKFEEIMNNINKESQYMFDDTYKANMIKQSQGKDNTGSQPKSFFTQDQKDAFTPKDYEKERRWENMGWFGHAASDVGNFVWDTVWSMTGGLIINTAEFADSLFTFNGNGIDWGAGAGMFFGALGWVGLGGVGAAGDAIVEGLDVAVEAGMAGTKDAAEAVLNKTAVKGMTDKVAQSGLEGLTSETSTLFGEGYSHVGENIAKEYTKAADGIFAKTIDETTQKEIFSGLGGDAANLTREELDTELASALNDVPAPEGGVWDTNSVEQAVREGNHQVMSTLATHTGESVAAKAVQNIGTQSVDAIEKSVRSALTDTLLNTTKPITEILNTSSSAFSGIDGLDALVQTSKDLRPIIERDIVNLTNGRWYSRSYNAAKGAAKSTGDFFASLNPWKKTVKTVAGEGAGFGEEAVLNSGKETADAINATKKSMKATGQSTDAFEETVERKVATSSPVGEGGAAQPGIHGRVFQSKTRFGQGTTRIGGKTVSRWSGGRLTYGTSRRAAIAGTKGEAKNIGWKAVGMVTNPISRATTIKGLTHGAVVSLASRATSAEVYDLTHDNFDADTYWDNFFRPIDGGPSWANLRNNFSE